MNVADPERIKDQKHKERRVREQELFDVRAVLCTPEGRRFFWRLLSLFKVFGSIWESSARIHYNSGQQDCGHFLLAEASEADPEAYLLMQKEAMKREREESINA